VSEISLEEMSQRYLDAVEAEEEARFTQSAIAWSAREMSGKAALEHIAHLAHRKPYKLVTQADTFDLVKLREDRPTLTWLHLNILMTSAPALLKVAHSDDAWAVLVGWADDVVDKEYTPAQLRAQIKLAIGGPLDDPSVIVHKAESSTTKLRKVADEADQVGVLQQVKDRVDSLHAYVTQKARVSAKNA